MGGRRGGGGVNFLRQGCMCFKGIAEIHFQPPIPPTPKVPLTIFFSLVVKMTILT